jgi:hypothetical protein
LVGAGSWSAYWYNGYIVSSEIARGLDVFELVPSGFLSQNEIDAAKLVRFEFMNAQDQQKLVWPASFAVARAYLDQLARSNGLASDKVLAARQALAQAERRKGQPRRDALMQLAAQLNGDAPGAGPTMFVDGVRVTPDQAQVRPAPLGGGARVNADQPKVRMLVAAVTDLANAER